MQSKPDTVIAHVMSYTTGADLERGAQVSRSLVQAASSAGHTGVVSALRGPDGVWREAHIGVAVYLEVAR